MGNAIKLSQKYGVNPALTKCFWCGEDMGIALLGKLNGDVEAPKYVFGGYEPCDKCKQKFGEGVLLMEAGNCPTFENQPAMQKDVYPTGRHLIMKREAAKRIFNCDSDKAFIDHELFDQIVSKLA